MKDRELLELAAKASGYKKYYSHYLGRDSFVTYEEAYYSDVKECQVVGEKTMNWNPLTDDGDALRLAVKLKIDVLFGFQVGSVQCIYPEEPCESPDIIEPIGEDPYAATRRAIVRAAAEFGKAMP